jgi:hypothetical protein
MSRGDQHVVVLAGWNVGLRTIDLMKLVRARTSLNLATAEAAVDRVVDGEQVALTLHTPSSTTTSKWTFRLRLDPNLWTKLIAPHCARNTPSRR